MISALDKQVNLAINLTRAYKAEQTYNTPDFRKFVESVDWDEQFFADEETYYLKDGLTLTVENLDVSKARWLPTIFFADGSNAEIEQM